MPAAACQAVLEVKKSEFLAFAYPIVGRDGLQAHLALLKASYPDARHICYGYIIGDPNNTTSAGFDDDGEPNGTAGRPILSVLQHRAIGNCAIIVVRYFGGVKLGAGGLTRAYARAAQLVVDEMVLTTFVPMVCVLLEVAFSDESFVRHHVSSFDGVIEGVSYADNVQLTVRLARDVYESFCEKVGQSLIHQRLTSV